MRARTGYVYQNKKSGTWYGRVTYVDQKGKRKNVQRRAANKEHAKEVLKKLVRTLDDGDSRTLDAERFTFRDLAEYYTEHYVQEAQYSNGRKVAGLRSAVTVQGYVKVLQRYFGGQRLSTITYDDLRALRAQRLKTSTQQSAHRSLTTVNREMAYLRRMLNIAERNGWIPKNPFKMGDALIHIADEVKRERLITRDEESRLLAECVGPRAHLRPIIICALDTGMRQGEILKLCWRDVGFGDSVLTVDAFNTKTLRQRQVSITARLALELERLWENSRMDGNALVFGLSDVRQAFKKACKEAGLDGLRFHDLRHTHASRLDDLGFSLAKIGSQLGHTVLQTTLRYVNRDKAAIKQVASALDTFNSAPDRPEAEVGLVN